MRGETRCGEWLECNAFFTFFTIYVYNLVYSKEGYIFVM